MFKAVIISIKNDYHTNVAVINNVDLVLIYVVDYWSNLEAVSYFNFVIIGL